MSEDDYLHGVDVGIDLYIDRARVAEALAASRLELLRRLEKKMVFCLLCDGRLDNFGEKEELKALGYNIDHADGCELAKAVGDD